MSITIEPLNATESVLNGVDHARRLHPGNRQRESMSERSMEAITAQDTAALEQAAGVVDKHLAASRVLEALGWTFDGLNWLEPARLSADFCHSDHLFQAITDPDGPILLACTMKSGAHVCEHTLIDVEAAYNELQPEE